MVRLCLMASYGYSPGLVIKDSQPFLQSPGIPQEITQSGSLNLKVRQFEESWSPLTGFSDPNKFIKIGSTLRNPPDSILLSYGIAENCARQEETLQFLSCQSCEVQKSKLDLSLMGSQISTGASFYDEPSLVVQFNAAENLLVDFVGDLARYSKLAVGSDGQVSFTGSGSEMKDLLSIVAEFYLSKKIAPAVLRKQSVVPYFHRRVTRETRNVQTVKVAPLKSPEKVRLKPSQKRHIRERDFYKKSYFHACESLLSLMMMNKRPREEMTLVLKTSGPDVPKLLTKFSACIAGTGLAVVFSVACKVACARVPFCTSKLFSTGIGFGLVWLSMAVNRLSNTFIHIIKNHSGRMMGLEEEEMMKRVDKSMKQISFRAATLMAVVLLKLA